MKLVFRTYTKKDGTPENGVYALLQYFEGLKDKDILVRVDIDKKNRLGYDEVDIFCPSLKISHLELRQLDNRKFEATFDTKHPREVFVVLLNVATAANPGHSFEMLVGDKSFYIDGDGADYIESINGYKHLSKIYDNRHEWPKIYNEPKEDEGQVINESKLRKIIQETLSEVLNNNS